jgi:16S rRNA (cytosine1402-N4)-methyltransferase
MNKLVRKKAGFSHIPVLLTEVLDGLNIQAGKQYIDATTGGGGHTQEIIQKGGRVLAIDQDDDALSHLQMKFAEEKNIKIVKGNFGEIEEIAHLHGIGKSAGVLFDLGMSSFQIDSSTRGFSFHKDQPLDMRMDEQQELTAYDVVNRWTPDALREVLLKYGEEHQATQVVDAIVSSRKIKKIETTAELVAIIKKVIRRNEKIHPATKVFQAIRIAVNAELEVLRKGLNGALQVIDSDGRIVVISFHSLEDRIVKNTFREFEQKGYGQVFNKKPITATDSEIEVNPRSRSAKMRIFIKK